MELTKFDYKPYLPRGGESSPYITAVRPNLDYVEAEYIGDDGCLFVSADDGATWQTSKVTAGKVRFAAQPDTTVKFYVLSGGKKSNVRIAKTGNYPGTVVNYLHPDDKQYEFSGNYLASPSIVRTEDGTLFVLHDVFAAEGGQNLSILFRSDDDGAGWNYVTDIFPLFWATLFVYRGKLCAVGCSKEYGDMEVLRSDDEGKTWQGTTLARGSYDKDFRGFHRCPDPVVEHDGRLWVAMEYGSWKSGKFCPSVWSLPLGEDILDADKWVHTPDFEFDFSGDESDEAKWGGIEGNLVVTPEGKLVEILRHDKTHALVLSVDADKPDAPLTYIGKIPFELSYTKFHIQCLNGIYCALGNPSPYRNELALYVSKDCKNWTKHSTIIDLTELSPQFNAAQYPSFVANGNTLYIASRVAVNGAANYHDNNCICFNKYVFDGENNDVKKGGAL